MGRFRIAVPVALAASAIAISVLGPAIHKPGGDTTVHDVKNNEPVFPTPRVEPVYDEEGRRVYVVGDLQLHIPASYGPTSTTSSPGSTMVQVGLCWPRDEKTGECSGIQDVAIIFLQAGNKRPEVEDSMARLQREFSSVEGPFDSGMEGIWEFHLPSSDAKYYFAIAKPDSTGRHVTARCDGGPRCRSWITVVPGLTADYTFDKRNLPIWAEIDNQVREQVKSFVIESAVD